ncbi:hypothetical protein SNK03_009208 [Fusarium graminearum]
MSGDPPSDPSLDPSSDTPKILVNDNPVEDERMSKATNYRYDGNGLVPIQSTEKDLGKLLRNYCVDDGIDGKFWTNALLRHILSQDRIKNELMQPKYGFNEAQVNEYVSKIHPHSENVPSETYTKVFALLALTDKVHDIGRFVEERTCDKLLPILITNDTDVCSVKEPGRRLLCFDGWKTHELEFFEARQWWVDTPYFGSTGDKPLTEVTLERGTHKPWRRTNGKKRNDRSEGAYGIVIPVEIHPTAHSYHHLLRDINLDCTKFAVKVLNRIPANTKQTFQDEWDMLKRFSGLYHAHLVTALSAVTQDDEWSFIFPCASYDFETFKENVDPPQGVPGVIWLSTQLEGLIGAIDTIHVPKHLHLGPERKYGRHGDIKCDNVLCFKKSGPEGDIVLVISDFGLSKFNSDKSRSNIPNAKVPPVPGYRPPECDIEGGTVSRAFDVWTIGCLFLELVTWFLGGPSYIREFEEKRTTKFINGMMNNIFFTFGDLVPRDPDGAKAILVKPEVTEWILKLRQHVNCSPFVHEVLDIVEQKMLVVLSTGKTRSSSGDLRGQFQQIAKRCKSEPDYTQGRPWTQKELKEARDHIEQNTVAVRVVPNDTARTLMETFRVPLLSHTGRTEMSYTGDHFSKMDIVDKKEDLNSSGN